MANIDSLMEMPWAKRAMDSNTPTLNIDDQEATVQTMSSNYDGKEILYPTIRMIDGQLQKLDNETAKKIAIEKNDYVAYDTPKQATNASKELSYYIGFARDPKGTMEKEEKAYQDKMANMKFGTPMDYIKGVMAKETNEDTTMKLAGEQYRNILEFYRTSIPFMKLYDYFNPEKKGE